MTVSDRELLIHIEDGIAHVKLNRPQARNALTFEMYEGLAALCAKAGTDDDADHIRAIIISGAGDKAFAAGTDIGQFTSFSSTEDGLGYESKVEAVISAIEACRTPVIAALMTPITSGLLSSQVLVIKPLQLELILGNLPPFPRPRMAWAMKARLRRS